MKKIFTIIFILGFLAEINTAQAQCSNFAKEDGIAAMDTSLFIHDGRFNAIKLKQGDDIYIYKAFYAHENYRIVVVAAKDLPNITFELTDFKKKEIIFSNTAKETYFDFTPEKSQRAIIHIVVPSPEKNQMPKKGCVAVLFGLKKE